MLPHKFKLLYLLLIFLTTSLSIFIENIYGIKWWEGVERLPQNLSPYGYNLKLHPQDAGYYNGSVNINFTCVLTTNKILLHASENLNIQHEDVFVTHIKTGYDIQILSISRNYTSDIMSILLEEEMQPGDEYQVHILFNANLINPEQPWSRDPPVDNAKLQHGFYSYKYEGSIARTTRWFAATNMAPRYARRVFPCFDEPSFKAKFQISIARSVNMSTLSVMPLQRSERINEESEDWVWDHYPPTPDLSTLSLNVMVSNFSNKAPIQVQTRLSNFTLQFHMVNELSMNISDEQIDIIIKQIQFLEDYLSVPYPLPKLDIVLLQHYFSFAKQSSLGLVINQEIMLTDGSTTYFILDIVDTWIGHLLTPSWWSEVDTVNMLALHLIRETLANTSQVNWLSRQSFNFYKYSSSHEMQKLPKQYTNPYFAMKGEWLLQMLNYSLPEGTLQRGIRKFVSYNLYSTFTGDMLWQALSSQADEENALPRNLTIEMLVDSWINKSLHFPVLTVTRNYIDFSAALEQHVFMSDIPHNLTQNEKNLMWWIPLNYITLNGMHEGEKTWMGENRNMRIGGMPDSCNAIIMNPINSGMFVVNYDSRNWQLLSEYLTISGRHVNLEIRTKLLQDVMMLAKGGEVDYGTALNMTLFLFKETDKFLMMTFMDILRELIQYCQWTPVQELLYAYIRELLIPMYETTRNQTYQNTNDLDMLSLRYGAERLLEMVGYQPLIDKNKEDLARDIAVFSLVEEGTGLTLYCPEFMRDSSSDWTKHIRQLKYNIRMYYYREDYMLSHLSNCPGYVDLIKRVLNESLYGEMSSTIENWRSYMKLFTSSRKAHLMASVFVAQHFEEYKHRYFYKREMWTTLLTELSGKFKTRRELYKMTQFYTAHRYKLGYSKNIIKTCIRKLSSYVTWYDDNMPQLLNWFENMFPALKHLYGSNLL